MKVFVDECVDWRLSRDIVDHEVKTARQMGWSTIKNGELLALAAKEFEVFVTVDRNGKSSLTPLLALEWLRSEAEWDEVALDTQEEVEAGSRFFVVSRKIESDPIYPELIWIKRRIVAAR